MKSFVDTMYDYFKETACQWTINCEKGEGNNLQNKNFIKSASETQLQYHRIRIKNRRIYIHLNVFLSVHTVKLFHSLLRTSILPNKNRYTNVF